MDYLRQILAGAVQSGASDIHIKSDAPLVYRISGELTPLPDTVIDEATCRQIAQYLIPPYMKSTFEQSREVDFSFDEPGIGRFRANIFQQRSRLSMAFRHVKGVVPQWETLGLPDNARRLADASDGIILVCGATGSGKSTTMAALLDLMNESRKLHIVTLEDPIEYLFEDKQSVFNQREVGLDTATFQTALVNVMRQDPDVIMIGEMRDDASVLAAFRAAETGHLVLSTLHSSTATQAVTRLLDFFPPEEQSQIRRQFALCLRGIMCQRLIPAKSGEGVCPAVEILLNTPTVRKLLEEDKLDKLPVAIETGKEDGMQNFNQSLYDLVKADLIAESVALEHASNPDSLKMRLKGINLGDDRRIMS
ncbi:PilT/PilU family type 4a pilus ATPase [Oscillatoria amoena NRMC-F 0135]|nr:PilT/PilU family type 4a pilus ATPase [Oscillatoria laete-virens]MDL5046592.1 PilT/PilU family type 4a pilus ATPase [Oscillatoria amoena NRMC-F 0135]MDL5053582.1 PilT/PilU family type 4a pilus ATPase [Oscillatoria laete-virens NRMC-F 0139]